MTRHASVRRWVTGVVGFLVGLCGCERAPARSPLAIPTVVDSAGVRLVDFDNNLPDERNEARSFNSAAASWRFSGGATDALHRVAGAAFLDDGSLVVAHASLHQAILLDSLGKVKDVVGRLGSGPGEFRALEGPWRLRAGRFGVYDAIARRLSVYAANGALQWITSVRADGLPPDASRLMRILGVTEDGVGLFWADGRALSQSGMDRPPMWVVAIDSLAESRTIIGPVPGLERYVMPSVSDVISFGLSVLANRPLGAPCGRDLLFADNARYVVSWFTLAGVETQRLRVVRSTQTADSVDYARSAQLQSPGREVTSGELAAMRAMTPSGLVPMLRSLRCDERGDIWVEESPRGVDGTRRVLVFTADGRYQRTIALAMKQQLLDVRRNKVALLVLDSDGAEHVELHTIAPL